MSEKSGRQLAELATQSTWTLSEGAHLVHSVNPEKTPVVLSETSSNLVARTYFWLLKEYGKGRLYAFPELAGEPRFTPGILMRHLEKAGHYVAPSIREMHDAAHGNHGTLSFLPNSKAVYLAAAELIWAEHPDYKTVHVAGELETLPGLLQAKRLKSYTAGTIRKWLANMGPGRVGRPKKADLKRRGDIDLAGIAEKLSEN